MSIITTYNIYAIKTHVYDVIQKPKISQSNPHQTKWHVNINSTSYNTDTSYNESTAPHGKSVCENETGSLVQGWKLYKVSNTMFFVPQQGVPIFFI